jgi:hypothetical protein
LFPQRAELNLQFTLLIKSASHEREMACRVLRR